MTIHEAELLVERNYLRANIEIVATLLKTVRAKPLNVDEVVKLLHGALEPLDKKNLRRAAEELRAT